MRERLLRVFLALALASIPLACGSSDSAPANADDEGALAGRTFIVKVPAGYDGSHPVPLVVALHGYGNDAGAFEPYFGLDAVADEHEFIVVYPAAASTRRVGDSSTRPTHVAISTARASTTSHSSRLSSIT